MKKILFIVMLLIILAYVTNITSIPKSIILFQGENLKLHQILGVYIKEGTKQYKTIQTASSLNNDNTIETTNIKLSLFNVLDLKEIEVNIIPTTKIIPLGNTIGLKLYTKGVLVIGMSEILGKKPYENSGIEEGDIIVSINNKQVTNTEELIQCVNSSNGKAIEVIYVRDGLEHLTKIEPVEIENNKYKIGLWVRDGATGIGTITYYEQSTGQFAALGHGIVDKDTEELVQIESGKILTAKISSIIKGEQGKPGEIRGIINNETQIGQVVTNTGFGIYGEVDNQTILNISNTNELEVALRDEIKTGPAKVILTLEEGIRKEYDIEITKIHKDNNKDNKSMLIKITDKELLNKTGGIIQRNEWSTNNTKWKIYTEQ